VSELVLEWSGEGLRFSGRVGTQEFALDGDGEAALSPVQALAAGLAGCMASDVVHILQKSRLPLAGLSAALAWERSAGEPRRVVALDLRFTIRGEVPPDRVERAIALSRETYCSVWHSLRPDIAFTTSFDVGP
jgi:putative redox protein